VFELPCKGKLPQYEVDAIFEILDEVVVALEEDDVVIVYFVVGFIVLLDADIEIVLVYYLDVLHVFVDDVLVDFTGLLPQVQEVFVVTVSDVLHLSTVQQQLPDRGKTFEAVLVQVELLQVG
jgi:hypothetical protein